MRHFPRVAVAVLALAAAACGGRRPGGLAQDAGAPIVILVSLDGFRWDYLDRHPTPNLKRLAASGVRARWMTPSFPTQTFPNHYTIVTGLRPARSGMVNNTFLDPVHGRFRYTDTLAAARPVFWQGEPLWVTASRQGRRTASFFWPGSDVEIAGVRPDRWKRYDGGIPNAPRVDSVLSWITLPEDQRPSFVTLYFSDVDHYGHENGPESPELARAVVEADSLIGRLMAGIRRAGLESRVNVIVVSDHGMATTSPERLVYLDDYVDRTTINAINLGQFIALSPNDGDTAGLLRRLAPVPHIRVHAANATPERWHYRGNPRIAPVVGVADAGWTLGTRGRGVTGGAHGFDNAEQDMQATFIAAGPAFRRGATVPPFQNIHVYELVCAILGLTPGPNDGSLDSVRTMLR